VKECDVFIQGYRHRAMELLDFGVRDIWSAKEKERGFVYVIENCYGQVGPWIERPGWEQQAVTGMAAEREFDSHTMPLTNDILVE
jgi:crotonobetainyl-CoA:carnitine CoA-transferase CaiB-like acyl-CoA transferase